MAWNNRKTNRVFMCTLVCTMLIAIGAIVLMAVIITGKKNKSNVFSTAFAYITGVLFINGIGCIWFKIFRNRLMWTHALIHTIAFGLIIFGDLDMFKKFNLNKMLRRYILSLFTLIVYTLEFLLSFHLIIFRPGTSASNKAFRSGIHAFGGSLTFFIGAVDSFVVWRRVSWEDFDNKNFLLVLVFVLQFAFACCIWYLLLNPYFDWRRLRSMSTRKKSSRTPSRSSSRIKL